MESLRRPVENQIKTATDFYTFVKNKFKNVQVEYISQEVIEKLETDILIERFKISKTITGTLGFHSFEIIPGYHCQVNLSKYSFAAKIKTVSVIKNVRKKNVLLK